ncbi:ABC transporter transmembrane domain-containing protein [Rhizobiaceae bacterium]|nr:ABC transporter transmembrane domain-containing protein [Rhizobiaceae bacterium]
MAQDKRTSAREDLYAEANQPLDPALMRYIWRHTRAQQLWIGFVILLSMPTYFLALQLPVKIVNQPIQGVGFEDALATQPFLPLSLGLPDFLGGASWTIFDGWQLERWPYLVALSCSFLALVCLNGLFKYYINTFKGRLGERMLRRMRYQLVDRVLRFPISHFKRVKGSEVSSMIKDEVEPFGLFIGDAFVQPLYLGGQAMVAFIFILNQSLWLGGISVAIIAVQMTVIPWLRKRVIELGRQRQLTARLLSGRIGEIVDGITAVHVNDTSNYERAELSNRLGQIFFIRYELYQRKFFIKFLNNFLAQVTPFLFYVVGGYFTIIGQLNVGQLIGVINAYKDLPSPINGLIMWDQQRIDINVKYAQIIEQFNVAGMTDARLQAPDDAPSKPITGDIQVSNLRVVDDSGSVLLEDADFVLPVSSITAVVGPLGSGAGAAANTLAGLLQPTSGRLMIGGDHLIDLPQSVRGRRFAYAGSESYLPQATLLDSLLYVNRHAPLRPLEASLRAELLIHPKADSEKRAAGNTLLDYYADWTDYDAMGIKGPDEIYPRIHDVLEVVEMDGAVYDLAMRHRLEPKKDGELCAKLLEVRATFAERTAGSKLAEYVEIWEQDRYNGHATVAENLLFGSAADETAFAVDRLAGNETVREILAAEGLDETLFEMGVELAETAIELFADLSPDNPFFDQLNFMTPAELEVFPPILQRAREKGWQGIGSLDREALIALPFGYIEQRNRLKLVDEAFEARILKARAALAERLKDNGDDGAADGLSLYADDAYNGATSVRDNIIFGRIAHGFANAAEEIDAVIREIIDEMKLSDDIFRVGLEFDVGTGGKRLSENQRQRIVLARALLKGADLLIVSRGLNSVDQRTQRRIIKRVLERARGEVEGRAPFGLFWVLSTPQLAPRFDKVLYFERQRIVGMGTPEELAEGNERFAKLVA